MGLMRMSGCELNAGMSGCGLMMFMSGCGLT